jgi:NTP pyrophosphatase (non-canonical NTP hydrolase)
MNEWAKELHENSVNKGFYEGVDMTEFNWQSSKLMLIVSEVSETMEALRKSMGSEEVVKEISDTLIRTLDLYEALREVGVVTESLDEVFEQKAEFNKTRPHLHGGRLG